MLAQSIGLIGSGRMATALARGWVRSGLQPAWAITASDPSATARTTFAREVPGSTVIDENQTAAQADIVLLAVKPQQMDDVLAAIHDAIRRESLVVSIAAGIGLERLAGGLPVGQRIVRVMPNTPCLVGCGASCYSLGAHATHADAEVVARLLSAVGIAREVPEKLLDAVTGLSGSGPAFVYTMIEAMSDGATSLGLPSELAAELAAQTAAGAAKMVIETGESPAALREQVTSPGGTTVAGLGALEEHGFRNSVIAAVTAAARRSAELGRSKR
jgi:pyrroline-5-carboxylate reductase